MYADMSDMGNYKPKWQKEEAEEAVEYFTEEGVYVTGQSMIELHIEGKTYYYWPGTHKWRVRGKSKEYGCCGHEDLLKRIRANNDKWNASE